MLGPVSEVVPGQDLVLPLHYFAQNRIGCAIVALAVDFTAWIQTLNVLLAK